MDPVLLLSDKQIKAEVEKVTPAAKAKFDNFASFAEDWHDDSSKYEPIDHVMKHLVKVRYPGIPPAVASQLVQPRINLKKGLLKCHHLQKALVIKH